MKFANKWLRPYDIPLIVLSFAMVALYVAVAGPGFPLDDSWIHQTYARNLAQSREWAFLSGVPSAASTSPLYTVLLAIGRMSGLDFYLWTHTLGAGALALCAMAAARLGDRIPTGWRHTGTLTGILVALTWHLVWAAASGMETMLFACFTLILMLLAWREQDDSGDQPLAPIRGLMFGVTAALMVCTRPEALLLAGLLGLGVWIATPRTAWPALAVWSGCVAAGFAVAITPYLLLNLHLTGGLLPNTSAAKQAEYAPVLAMKTLPELSLNFLGAIIVGGQALLVPGIIFYAMRIHRQITNRRALFLYLVPLIWIAGLIILYASRLPMYSQHGRYVIPALPALIVCGTAGTAMLMRAARRRRFTRLASHVLTASAAVLFFCFAFLIGPVTLRQDVGIINGEMVQAAYWLRDNLPPEKGLLALHDIGAVGYFAPRPMIDTAGLVTPDIVPVIGDAEALWAFLQQHGADYFLGLPDQIPGGDINDSRLCRIYTHADAQTDDITMSLYALNWGEGCPQ